MDDNKPFLMLNALWFKPEGGRESYNRYMAAVAPILESFGGRPLVGGAPFQGVIGEFDADLVFFVEYPNWQTFLDFVSSPRYQEIGHYREEAITKSLLIRCEKVF
ncbi:MAG: DUF1330 domain-containing protein [Proteobacteria bacterium]|nr:DUF1330 domain-containing protein [Pseudomonadota bacterium]